MSCEAPYKGHEIFQNQPSSSYYDKSFQNATDVLYLHLNEIEPYFLQDSSLQNVKKSVEDNYSIIDPRLQKEVENIEYDHSDEHFGMTPFESPLRSCLNQKQHAAGIRVLQAWRQCEDVESSDFQTWLKMARYLQAERQRAKKYVEDYMQKHKASIYQCTKRLLALYQKWYALEVKKLIQIYPENTAYNTKAGLPSVFLCKPLEDELRARINNRRCLKRAGYVRIHNDVQINYKVLSIKLEDYSLKYMTSMQKELLDKNIIDKYLEENTESSLLSCYLPLDTLLYLLLAGEYVDLPTEVLMTLKEREDGGKCIYFENPLPSRNCGWHTHQQVVQQAYLAKMSLDSNIQWLQFKNNKLELKTEDHLNINASKVEETAEYQADKFDDFMQKYLTKMQHTEIKQNCMKSNETLVSWQLETYNEEADKELTLNYMQMITKLELPAAQNSKGQQFYGSDNIKLEYKPTMGCEVLTKYELLKLWLLLQLNEASEGLCTRLSADNFELLLQEHLTLGQIEQNLYEQHHLRMPQILVKLHEFLKMLGNMSNGNYMLRFNPKYAHKLLLCEPTVEINTNTIYLHNLLNVIPSDICFMTGGNVYLPLSENLCSRLHCKYNILPCTFPPATNDDKPKKKLPTRKVYFNDRELILQRVEELQKKVMSQDSKRRKKKKSARKVKKRQEKRAAKALEVQAQEECEQDILNDETLFG